MKPFLKSNLLRFRFFGKFLGGFLQIFMRFSYPPYAPLIQGLNPHEKHSCHRVRSVPGRTFDDIGVELGYIRDTPKILLWGQMNKCSCEMLYIEWCCMERGMIAVQAAHLW